MNNVIYVLNEELVAVQVECGIDLENLEGCEVFETLPELEQAYTEAGESDFDGNLVTVDADEIVSSVNEGIIGTVDSDVAVYVSAFEL